MVLKTTKMGRKIPGDLIDHGRNEAMAEGANKRERKARQERKSVLTWGGRGGDART